MSYYLLKTEPGAYSWSDLAREKKATWDGISNATALIHLRAMSEGDQLLIYHTGNERACVGIAEVIQAAYPDPKQSDPRLVAIDIKPVKPLTRAVTLDEIKADKTFAGWDLLRIGRLSVVPTSKKMWNRILKLADEPRD